MGLDLNKVEKRIEDLLARAGNETTPEEEARTSAVLAARKIREENKKGVHDLHVIDVKEYDAVWQKELDELRLKVGSGGGDPQVEALQKDLQAARRDLESARREAQYVKDLVAKAQQRESEARRQVEDLQRRASECANELKDLRARPAGAGTTQIIKVQEKAETLQRALELAREEARSARDLAKRARDAELDAKRAEAEAKRAENDARKQIETCSDLVQRLKSEKSASETKELVALQNQVKDLMFKVTVAQATARNLASLRQEDLERYERGRLNPSNDAAHALFAGLLIGGVVTMVGALVFRKIANSSASSTSSSSPSPSPAPTYQRTTPGRLLGT